MKKILLALLSLVLAPAFAQEPWPSRPVTLIVPYTPGAAPDLIARAIGDKLSVALGQPVVVANRSGSAGLIGGDAAAHSKPDGYTLLVGDDGMFAIAPHLYRHMTFNPAVDFAPITSLVENAFVLAIDPALPATDVASFLELARKSNPPLAYGSFGSGSQPHLTMERLKSLGGGVPMLHVPYRTSGAAGMAIVGHEIAASFVGASAASYIRNGRLRAIATTGATRSRTLPEVPTLSETYPGLVMTNWQGLFAPAGTPAAVIQRIEREVREILASEELAQRLAGAGDMRALVLGPDAFAQRIRRDSEKYREIIEKLDLKLD